MAASDPIGGNKFWFNGIPFTGVAKSGTDTTGLKYWFNGVPLDTLIPAPSALPVTITGIATDVTPVGPFRCSGAAQITASGGTGTNTNIGSTTVHAVAQSFTTIGAFSLGSMQFSLLRSATTVTDHLNIEIRSGSETGSLLGTSDNFEMVNFVLSLTATAFRFNFSTPVALSAATQYFAVIKRSGAYSATVFPIIAGAASFYAGGVASTSDSSDVWSNTALDFPFIAFDATAAYYFFGKDSSTSTTLQAYKATDPTSSWSSIATKTGFTTAVLNLAGFQTHRYTYLLNNIIHLIVCDGTLASSLNYKYQTFDMSTDTFVTAETIVSALSTAGQTGAGRPECSIIVRYSTSEAVVFFNGAQVVSTGNRARVYFSRRSAVATWAAPVLVDSGGAFDWAVSDIIHGIDTNISDNVHFLWRDFSANTLQERTLNITSLQTAASSPATTVGASSQGIDFVNTGVVKNVLLTTIDATNGAVSSYYNDSGAAPPTINQTTIYTGEASTSGPIRAFADDALDVVWALYRKVADGDLYVRSSSDNGATWSGGTLVFTAAVGSAETNLSKDGLLYLRGSDTILPYIVNNNGTLQYNEYDITNPVSSTQYAAFSTPQLDGQSMTVMTGY